MLKNKQRRLFQRPIFRRMFSGGPTLPRDGLIGEWLVRNGLTDTIGISTGPVQPGRAYTGPCTIAIAGLTTAHTITADSTDIPTCTVNGTLTIADGNVVYGFRTALNDVEDGYYPCAEGTGTICLNSLSGGLPHGVISADTVHTSLYDGSGFDANLAGFTVSDGTSDYADEYLQNLIVNSAIIPPGASWRVL